MLQKSETSVSAKDYGGRRSYSGPFIFQFHSNEMIWYLTLQFLIIAYVCSFQIRSVELKYWMCGYGTKVMHTTTDNIAYILFHSDLSIVRIGFNITFTNIEGMQVFHKAQCQRTFRPVLPC